MALSSNSLIHLTDDKKALIGILTENFKLKYCVENLLTQVGNLTYGVPMVSFCDIPMSEIKEHIDKYGCYGIGLTREWGQKNNLNPVFYVDKNSSIGKGYHETFNELFRHKKVSEVTIENSKVLDVFRYMKNYQADLNRNGSIIHEYRFADEKEWRYVPTKEEVTAMIVNANAYAQKKNEINKYLQDLRLSFEPKDIRYIIIKHDHEITEFIQILRQTKSKYAYEDVERLMTRIITVEQIKTDF